MAACLIYSTAIPSTRIGVNLRKADAARYFSDGASSLFALVVFAFSRIGLCSHEGHILQLLMAGENKTLHKIENRTTMQFATCGNTARWKHLH